MVSFTSLSYHAVQDINNARFCTGTPWFRYWVIVLNIKVCLTVVVGFTWYNCFYGYIIFLIKVSQYFTGRAGNQNIKAVDNVQIGINETGNGFENAVECPICRLFESNRFVIYLGETC